MSGYGLDAERSFLGYSNGANLLGAVTQLHPGTVDRAILIRAVQVLEDPPATDPRGGAGRPRLARAILSVAWQPPGVGIACRRRGCG